jgi:hypothetical protein
MDAISKARCDELYPPLGSRLADTINDCESVGIYLRLTRGKASPNEQHALYLQGRGDLAVVNDLRQAVNWAPITEAENQHTVTNADWLDSMHVYGMAGDVDPSEGSTMAPFNPDWDVQDAQWQKVLEIAAAHGLAEGAAWTALKRDYPHLYLKEMDANPTEEMKQTFKDAGLSAVWREVDAALGIQSS